MLSAVNNEKLLEMVYGKHEERTTEQRSDKNRLQDVKTVGRGF